MEPAHLNTRIAPFGEVLHTWVYDASTNVHLIRKQDLLEYEVVDIAKGILFKGPIVMRESETIEKAMERLKYSKVHINPNHKVRFLFCYHSWGLARIASFFGHSSETGEILHTWRYDASTNVHLIRKQDLLEYEVVDITKGTLFKGPIVMRESETIEKAIERLKKSKVCINPNDEVRFLFCYHSWWLGGKGEASLVKAAERSIMWNIFSASTQQCSLFSISNSTIPSARCHPETIARIQKIGTELLSIPNISFLRSLVEDFTVTRIVDAETIIEEMGVEEDVDVEEIGGYLGKDCENLQKLWGKYLNASYDLKHFNPLQLRPSSIHKMNDGMDSWLNQISLTSELVKPFIKDHLPKADAAGNTLATIIGTLAVIYGVAIPVSTLGLFYIIQKAIKEHRQQVIKAHRQKEIMKKKVKVLFPQKPLFVEIEPVSAPSHIDPRVLVSKFIWTVTLITGPGGESKAHTSIIVEGLVNNDLERFLTETQSSEYKLSQGQYFMYKFEFNPGIRSKIYEIQKFEKNRYGMQRSEIWRRSSEKVIAVLQEIEKEKKIQEKQTPKELLSTYSKYGKDSLLSGGRDNCFTWMRDHILKKMLDIDLVRYSTFPVPSSLFVYPKDYTKPFEKYDKDPVINEI